MPDELPELVYYYPDWIWHDSDWLKNLILFFDGVALLVPSYMGDRPAIVDLPIVTGLQEHGLLTILEPETVIDQNVTRALATAMVDILASGSLDDLATGQTEFHELSRSRLGYLGDPELAQMIYEELESRGLAKPSEDGVSIPMHPMVRSLILVLLAQLIRPMGDKLGIRLNPATDKPQIQIALTELLNLPTMASAGHVVSLDLRTVGVDVSDVPIDEILGFRADHINEYQKYARNLREFMREISQLPPENHGETLRDRQDDIEESARHLQRVANSAWPRRASFGLGISGAVWTVAGGDPIAGAIAMAAGLVGFQGSPPAEVGAFSYLFSARRRFG